LAKPVIQKVLHFFSVREIPFEEKKKTLDIWKNIPIGLLLYQTVYSYAKS